LGAQAWKIPAGAKSPLRFMGFIGTTKVVPCYKALPQRVFPQPVKPPLILQCLTYGLKPVPFKTPAFSELP
jgi:hypothetical protein